MRALLRRGGAAAAVAAVVLGSTLGAATASTDSQAPPPASAPASPAPDAGPAPTTPAPADSAPTSPANLPDGLAAAVKRDLGMDVAEFNAAGALAAAAAAVQAEVAKADPSAVVSVKDGQIDVTAAPSAAAELREIAPAAKVTAAKPAPPVARAAGVDDLFQAYAAEFGIGKLQSIMVNAAGTYVIRTGEPAGGSRPTPRAAAPTISVRDFAADYANVAVEQADGPAAAHAEVVNGQGYVSELGGGSYDVCTVGWNAFSRQGSPAAISAGHCTRDGTEGTTYLSDPTIDEAGSGSYQGVVRTGTLGTFGFSQFGGPNNSPVTGTSFADMGNVGTDVSVIDGISAAVNQLPIVTDWSTPRRLAASGPKVTSVADAIIGTPVCKSGRTTGWTCQTVSETGVFIVQGINFGDEPGDLRAVRGFGALGLKVGPGDSGGPVIAGTTAVGIISAGGTFTAGPDAGKFIAYATDLADALRYTDGYTLKIFVNPPALATPANKGTVYRGGTITGTVRDAPAGTIVDVLMDGRKTTAAVNAKGIWTVKAPNKVGSFTVTARSLNGFSTSATATFTVTVVRHTLPAPVITAPRPNATVSAPVEAITGTGTPGATVRVTGAGAAIVTAGGTWTVPLSRELGAGRHTVTAVQVRTDWNNSKPATRTFTVLAAPAATGALTLARTGTPAGLVPLGAAGGLLVLGGTAVVLSRNLRGAGEARPGHPKMK
ncbi:hypothetical protein [Specibacter sp. RAF43]|uniref:S1 family peptidase n=1 Tax=Specibacter sp. RAF43 TaxID=3233057 RepID=UPI003F9E5A7A